MLGVLTTRGRCVLAGGVAAAICALVLDERDLLRVAAFAMALPLLAAVAAGQARVGVRASRLMWPPRLSVADRGEAEIRLRNTRRFAATSLLVEDEAAEAVGGARRFSVRRLPRHDEASVRYGITASRRGFHRVGPMTARVTDPFGLAEFTGELVPQTTLVVTPRVVPLSGVPTGSRIDSTGHEPGRHLAAAGLDDVLVRDYQYGDDLRRVHWRATARHGELMVRLEEPPPRGGCCVLLDDRASAHAGTGQDASIEYAISLVASICVHLEKAGRPTTLRGLAAGSGPWPAVGSGPDEALLGLAALVPSDSDTLTLPTLPGGDDTLIAVLGQLDDDQARRLAAAVAEHPRRRNHAVLLDLGTWDSRRRARPQRTARVLTAAGWGVVVAGSTDAPGDVWQDLCRTPAAVTGGLR